VARAVAAGSRQVCESAVREYYQSQQAGLRPRVNDEPDFSPYDYDSIMHYGAFADCSDELRPASRPFRRAFPSASARCFPSAISMRWNTCTGFRRIDHRGHTCEWVEDRRRRRDLIPRRNALTGSRGPRICWKFRRSRFRATRFTSSVAGTTMGI